MKQLALSRGYWKLIVLILMICSISTGGCFQTDVIYTSFNKMPEEAFGAIRIATNDPIPITILGKTEITTKKNLGGYFAIHPNDLKAFIQCIKTK